MTFYDYKVAPAPRQVKRVKGTKSGSEAFAHTLADAINAAAREGWEYVRAESLPAQEQGGWFRRGAEVVETVLIFRRPRESLGPRLAAARPEPEADGPRLGAVERPVERPRAPQPVPPDRPGFAPRLRGDLRPGEPADAAPKPLRPPPRLGPADQI
jgi:hypothetical protein